MSPSGFPRFRFWSSPLAAFCAALAVSGPALAAGLTLEVNARRADGGALSALEGGALLELEARLVNSGPDPARLSGAKLEVEGPASALADAVAAAAAGAKAAGSEILWSEAVLAPGESRRLVFTARTPEDAEPGADLTLRLSAAGVSVLDDAPLRAESAVNFSLAPVKLVLQRALPPESSNPLAHGDAMRLILGAEFPAGRARGVALSAEIPPSAEAAAPIASSIGADLRCSGGLPPEIVGNRLIWRLGECRLDKSAAPGSARRAELSTRFKLRDADPFLAPEEAAAWRAESFRGRLEIAGATEAEAAVSAQMGGPLIGGVLTDPPERRIFEAGQSFEARYEIRNHGDAPIREFELWARPDEALDCSETRLTLEPEGTPMGLAACGQAASPKGGSLAPGASVNAILHARARVDAALGASLRLGLDAAGVGPEGKPPRMRVHMLEMEPQPPSPPRLSLAALGDWTESGEGGLFARPGDAAVLEAAFTPPRGVGRAALVVKARMVDPDLAEWSLETPASGVAPIRLGTPVLDPDSAAFLDSPILEAPSAAALDPEGWSYLRLPLGVIRVPPGDSPAEIKLRAPIRVDPLAEDARSGRRLEIRAALLAGGPEEFGETRRRVEGLEGLSVEIQEPDLALTVATDDADRVIRPGESAEFSADLCNLGEADAEGVALEAELGPGWTPQGPEATRLRRSDYDWPILEDAPVLRAETPYDPLRRVLRLEPGEDWDGRLEVGECLRLGFHLTAAADPEALSRRVVFRLAPYETGAEPRRYEPPEPLEIALREERLYVGPGAEAAVSRGAAARLSGEIAAPPTGGPYAIAWSLRSSAGLGWRAREGREAFPTSFALNAGDSRGFELTGAAPKDAPRGWTETLVMHATATDPKGKVYPASARWVLRLDRDMEAAQALKPSKSMALDRNCDGDLDDEAPQDALFESFKDVRAGECLVFRIRLKNMGATPLEDVELREAIQPGLRYKPGSATMGSTVDGFSVEALEEPSARAPVIYWRFLGVLPVGAEAEARYGAQAPPPPQR